MMTRTVLAAACALALAGCTEELNCNTDELICGNSCVAVQTDPANCGACGNACLAGEACRAGACTECAAACGAGQRCEDGLCVADVYAACFNTDQVRGANAALEPVGTPLATDDGPTAFARLGDRLYVANNITNSISELRFDPPGPRATSGTASLKLGAGSNLAFIAADDARLYASNSTASTLVAVDPASGPVAELPLHGPGEEQKEMSPAGIALAGGKAYVALFGGFAPEPQVAQEIVVVRVAPGASMQLVKRIELQQLADPGGFARPYRVLAAGNRVYVTLQNLDASYAPAGPGKLAVIDPSTDALDPAQPVIDLGNACRNPSDLAVNGSTLWVTCGFFDFISTQTIQSAGFLPVDLAAAPRAVGAIVPLTAEAPGSLTFCGGQGYAGDSASGTVLRLDPVTRQVTRSVVCAPATPMSFQLVADVECRP
jgi:DNA-binding beta-propeller fold protein YncE